MEHFLRDKDFLPILGIAKLLKEWEKAQTVATSLNNKIPPQVIYKWSNATIQQ